MLAVEQHKKKIAEKLREISQAGGQDTHTDDGNEEAEVPELSSTSSMLRKKLHVGEGQTKLNDILSSGESEATSSPLMQILGGWFLVQ